MAKGLVLDAQGFPLSRNQTYQIGRANAKPNNNVTRSKAAKEKNLKEKGFFRSTCSKRKVFETFSTLLR